MEKPIIIVIKQEQLQQLYIILSLILKILIVIAVLLYGPGILALLSAVFSTVAR